MASGRCSLGRAKVGSSRIFCSLTFKLSRPALGKAESSDGFLIAAFSLAKQLLKAIWNCYRSIACGGGAARATEQQQIWAWIIPEHLFCTAPSLGEKTKRDLVLSRSYWWVAEFTTLFSFCIVVFLTSWIRKVSSLDGTEWELSSYTPEMLEESSSCIITLFLLSVRGNGHLIHLLPSIDSILLLIQHWSRLLACIHIALR